MNRNRDFCSSITAAVVMKLVEDGRLRLSDKVFTLLNDLAPPTGQTADPRLADVTVLHALTHTHGMQTTPMVDPLWYGRTVSSALGEAYPATARSYARYWMGQPMSFTPGTNWSYGQIGYILLHLVIEKVTGKRYEDVVRETILTPVSASSIVAGRTPLTGRHPDEVRYYYPGDMPDNTAPSGTAPAAYGWHSIEGNIAAAGWVGTAADYLRFIAAIDGDPSRPDVLSATTIQQMLGRPLPIWDGATTWYGMGWYSRGGWPKPVLYHGGNTWGTANWVRRLDNGVTLVLLTNGPVAPDQQGVFTLMNSALVNAAAAVTSWPTTDLFPRF